jgi:hypothetical protein
MTIAPSPQMDELAKRSRARTARRPQSPADYLAAMDAALARLPVTKRIATLETAINRTHRSIDAVWNWAADGGDLPSPSAFTYHQLTMLSLEFSKRLAAARDEERGPIAATADASPVATAAHVAVALVLAGSLVFVGGLTTISVFG